MSYTVSDLIKWNDKIEEIVNNFGLSPYEQEFEIINSDTMIEYESYFGMPSRYPHWSFGKAYEKTKTLFNNNLTGLPYEMVINSDPCIAYLMKDNTLLLQILTIAHVYGHNDFFKNNRLFKYGTNASSTVEMFKTNSNLIRGYIKNSSIGYEGVENILDAAHSIKLQTDRVIGAKKFSYNIQRESNNIDFNKVPLEPEEDILQFIKYYGELEDWEENIIDVVRKETSYFIPQIETKIINEGWASFWHYKILKNLDLPQGLYLEFIKRHNDVVAPISYSLNPYYLGFKIFEDIEKRYGLNKLFEVRAVERDSSFLRRYLTKEICEDLNLFEYVKRGSEYIVKEVSDDIGWKEIRNTLSSSCGMGTVPIIKIIDMCKKDKTLTLLHEHDGRDLNMLYAESTLKYIATLWKHPINLITKFGNKEITFICDENKNVKRE